MSELIRQKHNRANTRWQLLAGVSAFALIANTALAAANSNDADRPTVWIELGGQLEHVDGGQERFSSPFISLFDDSEFISPLLTQRPSRYATGGELGITFLPNGSDWVFTAAARYGRSNNRRALHQELAFETAQGIESAPLLHVYQVNTVTAYAKRYLDTTAENHESHAVVDFKVGKDWGIGLFGMKGSSVLDAGVRFAQFESRSSVTLGGDPDFAFSYKYATKIFGIPGYFKLPQQHWHLFSSTAEMTRNFHGIGPSIAWDASALILGDGERGELSLDWGVNGAILFGRQKTIVSHQTTGWYRTKNMGQAIEPPITYQPPPHRTARSRSVVIPNVGGFAGLSFKFPNAKVSLGYRADVFFGAIDGGIDARKTYDRSFYGPFANFSIGL